jgi:hypothetical protein
MKTITLLCLLSFSSVAQDLRLIGTNLFDFSRAGHGIYYLGAFNIVKTFPQSIQIRQTRVLHKFVPDMAKLYGEFSSDLSRSVDYWEPNYYGKWENPYLEKTKQNWEITSRIANSPNLTSSTAEYFGILGKEIQIATNITFYVLNHPGGSRVDYCAVPTSTPGYWDHGIQFTGNQLDFKYIYRVLPDRITREHQYTPENLAAGDVKLFIYQLQQASNNVSADQYEVALRYRDGKSTPVNLELFNYWMRLAASNSYPAALKYLTNPPPEHRSSQNGTSE